MNIRRLLGAFAVIGVLLTCTACVSAQPAVPKAAAPSVVEFEVVGLLHITDEQVSVCYAEMQSYPPQCGGGIPVQGVDVADLPSGLFERADGVTWGWTRLVGTFEEGALTLTRDPMPPPAAGVQPTPTVPAASADAARQAELATIAAAIASRRQSGILSVGTNGEVVEVLVPLESADEVQSSFDAEFGPDEVVVESWLHPWPG